MVQETTSSDYDNFHEVVSVTRDKCIDYQSKDTFKIEKELQEWNLM
jgi:hypothetical protein